MPTRNNTREIQNKTQSVTRAKAALKRTLMRNAVATGREIAEMRKDAGVTRKQMCAVLDVRRNALYTIEHPNKASSKSIVSPATQARYYKAVKTFCSGVKQAAAKVRFERSTRGRPRNQY